MTFRIDSNKHALKNILSLICCENDKMTKEEIQPVDRVFMNHSECKSGFENLSHFIEPVFYLGVKKTRKLPPGIDPAHAFNSFEYRLKQNPKDLSCHLQRIQFSITDKNRAELFASICDLFVILGKQGQPLRQHLFNACGKALHPQQAALIKAHLTEKQLSETPESLPDNCYFKKEVVKLAQQTEQSINKERPGEDILHIAESYIENSQFDTALEYMQKHLEQDQKNKVLTLKLINLYKALDCADKFHSAYNKFSKNVATSLYWNDAKQYFSNQ